MQTKIIEAAHGKDVIAGNWGKFMVMRHDAAEWAYRSAMDDRPLLRNIGTNPNMIWVLDLQTLEGVSVRPGGSASADLNKHKVWVCPLFEPFLIWLYDQDLSDLQALPALVELPDAEAAMHGYRRSGDETRSDQGN